jgi:hypothetical protein
MQNKNSKIRRYRLKGVEVNVACWLPVCIKLSLGFEALYLKNPLTRANMYIQIYLFQKPLIFPSQFKNIPLTYLSPQNYL